MTGTDSTLSRPGNTRQRIQEAALALFAEQGYEKTSLREIAEKLDVTKAALYYHFKTKEDILVAIYDDKTRPIDELIDWGREQPPTGATRQEILRRYSTILDTAGPFFRFLHENQATLRELSLGERFRKRAKVLSGLLYPPGAPVIDEVRAFSALHTMHAGVFVLPHSGGREDEERRRAVLQVAEELVGAIRSEA